MLRKGLFDVSMILSLVLCAGVALGGTVTGTVKYDGKVPNLRPIKMNADPGCMKQHGEAVPNEMLVLGDGQTMANIMVRVKNAPKKSYPAPKAPAVLDQKGCQYLPHVLGVRVGQTVKILNSDGLLHNVHGLPEVNAAFNRAMPAAVTEADYTFDKAEDMFKIKCDVHPWMGAYVGVYDHPFFSVTRTDGKFKIDGLPAGTYEIEAWHEKLKPQTAKVTIAADGDSKSVDFTFSAPGGS